MHIRVVTIHASLCLSDTGEEPTIAVTEDGRIITLLYLDEKISIPLPTRIRPRRSSTSLVQASRCGNQYIVRLNLEDEQGEEVSGSSINVGPLTGIGSRNLVPWASHCMKSSESNIMCAQCGSNILSAGKVMRWLDLPNENWAELMEFWHCHKPSEHSQPEGKHKKQFFVEDKKLKATEYFAGNNFQVSQGKGFVGMLYFLLHKDDCTGVKVCEYYFHIGPFSFSSIWLTGIKKETSSTFVQ